MAPSPVRTGSRLPSWHAASASPRISDGLVRFWWLGPGSAVVLFCWTDKSRRGCGQLASSPRAGVVRSSTTLVAAAFGSGQATGGLRAFVDSERRLFRLSVDSRSFENVAIPEGLTPISAAAGFDGQIYLIARARTGEFVLLEFPKDNSREGLAEGQPRLATAIPKRAPASPPRHPPPVDRASALAPASHAPLSSPQASRKSNQDGRATRRCSVIASKPIPKA